MKRTYQPVGFTQFARGFWEGFSALSIDDDEPEESKRAAKNAAPDPLHGMILGAQLGAFWQELGERLAATGEELEHIGFLYFCSREGHGTGLWDAFGPGDSDETRDAFTAADQYAKLQGELEGYHNDDRWYAMSAVSQIVRDEREG